MALVLRDIRTNKALRAVSLGNVAELRPLFYRELRQSLSARTMLRPVPNCVAAGYSAFRRIVLRDSLGLKLDSRLFALLVRECDPYSTGTVTYHNFARHAKSELLTASRLGLRVERHNAREGSIETAKPLTRSSSQTLLQGPGFSQGRLRKELTRARSEAEVTKSTAGGVKPRRQQPKPRRGLLRHEISQLRGAGILLTEGQILRKVPTPPLPSPLCCQMVTECCCCCSGQDGRHGILDPPK